MNCVRQARSEREFPHIIDIPKDLSSFIRSAWAKGWLDDYSDDHFLIKAIENRLRDFTSVESFKENNVNFQGIVNPDNSINYEKLCINFCINFSMRMSGLSQDFGEENIKVFITDQLSAGKKRYDEDAFFEALSEVSILSFISRIVEWEHIEYEPSESENNKKNPEARFVGNIFGRENKDEKESVLHKVKLNIEVKCPRFPHDLHSEERIVIPTTLLSDEGRKILKDYCNKHELKYLDPRIMKIKDFINSASDKFHVPEQDEYNILYINWSYRDFPSNSFLEPYSLLTNKANGVLNYPELAKEIGIKEEAFTKITAIVCYTESLEGLMFGDFRYVWQRTSIGPRFFMWVIDEELREREKNDESDLLFSITGMNPSDSMEKYVMIDYKAKTKKEYDDLSRVGGEIVEIIEVNRKKML